MIGLARLSYNNTCHNHIEGVKGFWGGGREVFAAREATPYSYNWCIAHHSGARSRSNRLIERFQPEPLAASIPADHDCNPP